MSDISIDADSALAIATRLSHKSLSLSRLIRQCNLTKREEQARFVGSSDESRWIIDYPFSMSYVPFHVHIDPG